MATLIQDREVADELIADRRARGLDRQDEVWEGTYVIMPLGNIEHQFLIGEITAALRDVLASARTGRVYPGCNVSDRGRSWTQNFRCPDVAVYLNENPAIDHGAHWQGGPDLAIEIVSPDDRSHEKVDFYAAVGTRELLILDRDPWRLELFRATDRVLLPLPSDGPIFTETVGVRWQLAETPDGAAGLLLEHVGSGRRWTIQG